MEPTPPSTLLRRTDWSLAPLVAGAPRVVLVGAVRLDREALCRLLAHDGRLEVTAHVGFSGAAALEELAADVIVVDTAGHDCGEVVRAIVAGAGVPVVALGAPEDEEQVIALAELGVMAFVEPEGGLDDLVAAVGSAARGEAGFPPRVATTLLRHVRSAAPRRPRVEVGALTVRESQVAALIAEGLSNKEIAARLCIEVATVKNHVHNILEKLGVDRRFDAVERLRVVQGSRTA